MRVVVYGTGGAGGYFGAQLALSGEQVIFIARGEHLKALRANGIDVVAIHHHMTTTQPTVYFLHYWGKGPAQKLATGVKAAVDQLSKSAGHTH